MHDERVGRAAARPGRARIGNSSFSLPRPRSLSLSSKRRSPTPRALSLSPFSTPPHAPPIPQAVEAAFKTETVGLVTRDQYLARRSELEKELGAAGDAARAAAAAAAARAAAEAARSKARATARAKLSFDDGEEEDEGGEVAAVEEEEEEAPTTTADAVPAGPSAPPPPPTAGVGKDPTATTHFLPDAAREAEEAALRASLREEFEARRAAARAAPLEIVYSFWDGAGHRRALTVKAGDTVGAFLGAARAQLLAEPSGAFKDLRGVGSDGLLYVKEDLILPSVLSFHDLITRKARGKSGPLFTFDVHEDVRAVSDARKETDESHAGKVVTRAWYARNKHIFPASRWEAYDPAKVWDRYTVRGSEVQGK